MKALFRAPLPTFGDLRSRYDLHIVKDERDQRYSFGAVSGRVPGLKFYFVVQAGRGPESAILDSLYGTASILLPEYVGVKFASIPGFDMDRGNGGRILGSVGYFVINFADVNETALSPDDEVYLIG